MRGKGKMKFTTHPKLLAVLTAGAVLLSTGLASAQETPPAAPLEQQFDRYWADKRDVRNIHKRLFLKDGRWEFTISAGVIPNDDFFTYYPIGVKVNYYFTEDIAVELAGSYMIDQDSDLKRFLSEDILEGIQVELPQSLVWQAGAGVLWTPLHGKVAIFDTKLGHFDFGFALGVMALGTEVQAEGEAEATGRVDVGGNVGATVRFYLLEFLALRLDYRHYFYNARDADDNSRGLSYPAEISLGVSFFTSGAE
ncbi:MAG: outer membrane beta-barrel protein [Myxococcota bacterium]|jgi:outer membrane beta-barrel protein